MDPTRPLSLNDPTEPEGMEAGAASVFWIVDIARIQPYEHNPRHGRNQSGTVACQRNRQ